MRTGMLATVVAIVALAASCGGSTQEAAEPATVTVTVTETVTQTETVVETEPAVTAVAEPAEPVEPGVVDSGDLLLQYVPATDEVLATYASLLAESGLLELIVEDVNTSVALPQDVFVSVEETGDPSPFYQPDPAAIIVPPEFLAFTDQIFTANDVAATTEEAREVLLAATAFVVYHELGHMLVDQLDLPITGREEDAVDQLATLVASGEGEAGLEVATAGALFFGLLAGNREAFEAADFWDEHSLNEQRFFNIVCWFFGSDPQLYADLPAQAGLGEDRMVRCPDEFGQLQASWGALLAPYVLD